MELLTSEELDYIQKEEEAKKNTNLCKQYSYSSQDEVNDLLLSEYLLENMLKGRVWFPVKAGQTYRDVLQRIKEQYATSNRKILIPFDTTVVSQSDDLKLDDKIRAKLETDEEFQDFIASHDVHHMDGKEKKHEWIYVNIYNELLESGIISSKSTIERDFEKVKVNMSKMLDNHIFLDMLSAKLAQAKKDALKKMEIKSSFQFTLNDWQTDVINQIIDDGNKYYVLLSLAPRFGKTITIHEYVKTRITIEKLEKTVLVPISKDLASNSSFETDYYDGGYDDAFYMTKCSLFKDTDDIVKNLTNELVGKFGSLDDVKLILVTDEADRGSHTTISTDKMALIKNNFNVIQHIAMSGTGIAKASKIFKGVSEDDITQVAFSYTDLLAFNNEKVVKRRFFNFVFDINEIASLAVDAIKENGGDEEEQADALPLNFAQSFDAEYAHHTLSTMISCFVDKDIALKENKAISRIDFNDSDVVMVFINVQKNATLSRFVKSFKKYYGDVFETMEISGAAENEEGSTTNGTAQRLVKQKLITMNKKGIDKKLIIFSKGMASRSFSVPQIRKTIQFSDNELTSQGYQGNSRGLTYNYRKGGVQEADIIRLTLNPELSLSVETFMHEVDTEMTEDEVSSKAKLFLDNNSIAEYVFTNAKNTKLAPTMITSSGIDIAVFIDKVMKYNDRSQVLATRWYGEEIECEGYKLKNTSANTTIVKETIDNPGKAKKESKTIVISEKEEKENEKALIAYANVVRNIPYAFLPKTDFEITSIDDIIGLDDTEWELYLPYLDKEQFVNNIVKSETFSRSFESIINAYVQMTTDEKESRALELLELED